MTIVVNLIGGPGCQKSTVAAELFAALKRAGLTCELVREYAKEIHWEDGFVNCHLQPAITNEQRRRERLLLGKVGFLVTDSPVLLGLVYAPSEHRTSVEHQVRSHYESAIEDGHRFVNVCLQRGVKPYEQNGRAQTAQESRALDVQAYLASRIIGTPDEIDEWPDAECAKRMSVYLQFLAQ